VVPDDGEDGEDDDDDDHLSNHSFLDRKYSTCNGQKDVEYALNHLKQPNWASLVEIDAFLALWLELHSCWSAFASCWCQLVPRLTSLWTSHQFYSLYVYIYIYILCFISYTFCLSLLQLYFNPLLGSIGLFDTLHRYCNSS